MQFPILHIDGNLVANEQREVWAAYRLEPWHYDHLSHDERISRLGRLARLFWHFEENDGPNVIPQIGQSDPDILQGRFCHAVLVQLSDGNPICSLVIRSQACHSTDRIALGPSASRVVDYLILLSIGHLIAPSDLSGR
jgi:hypothetical protein